MVSNCHFSLRAVHLPLLDQLGNQEFGVFALRQYLELALEFARNHPPLLHSRVLDGGLDDSHRVVLEDKVLDTARDDVEELLDEFFPLVLVDM